VLIVTSDHGESLGERGWIGHNRVYDVQLKVPLVVHVPGVPPVVVDAPVESVDILPTVLGLLGIPGPTLPGVDLMDLAFGGAEPGPRVRLAEQANLGHRSVRIDQRWSLVVRRGGDAALYDLTEDPAEETDLIGSEPEVAGRLLAAYRQLGLAEDELAEFPEDLDAETLEQLRALGYAP
jgi:arylsulfatase A-like enzyme